MSITEKRIAGSIGEADYDELFALAAPYVRRIEKIAAGKVAAHFVNSPLEHIKVFEIGFGTGLTTSNLRDSDPRFHILGADVSAEMTEAARSSFAGDDHVEFVHMDALSLLKKQPDNSYDAAASGYCLHNIIPGDTEFDETEVSESDVTRARIMEEIARVVKPGGVFVNLDKYAIDDEVLHLKSLANQLYRFGVYLTAKVNRPDVYKMWFEHYIQDNGIKFTLGEQIALCKRHNFSAPVFTNRTAMDAIMVTVKL